MLKRSTASRSALALSLMLPGLMPVAADVFPDGTPTQICAISEVQVCERNQTCREQPRGNNESIRFIKFSLPERLAISTLANGSQRQSIVQGVRLEDDVVLLAGNDPGHAWSAAIEPGTWRLILSLGEAGRGVVLFGLCTPEG